MCDCGMKLLPWQNVSEVSNQDSYNDKVCTYF